MLKYQDRKQLTEGRVYLGVWSQSVRVHHGRQTRRQAGIIPFLVLLSYLICMSVNPPRMSEAGPGNAGHRAYKLGFSTLHLANSETEDQEPSGTNPGSTGLSVFHRGSKQHETLPRCGQVILDFQASRPRSSLALRFLDPARRLVLCLFSSTGQEPLAGGSLV